MKSIIASALFVASTVSAAGSAIVKNNCADPVYLWATDALRNPTEPTILKPGETYTETYHVLSSGGVSLKLNKKPVRTPPITQFEYTVGMGLIFYDGSHVDCRGTGCPFYYDGIYLEASDPTCPTRVCQPNADCTGFYINWNDDWNTLACQPNADIKMYLCSTSASGGTTPGKAATSSKAAAAAAAASPVGIAAAGASSAAAAGAPTASGPVIQMEAIHGMPSTLKRKAARATDSAKRDLHNHMARHMHHH